MQISVVHDGKSDNFMAETRADSPGRAFQAPLPPGSGDKNIIKIIGIVEATNILELLLAFGELRHCFDSGALEGDQDKFMQFLPPFELIGECHCFT